MSAWGHKQTFRLPLPTSALPPKAVVELAIANVCYGPITDSCTAAVRRYWISSSARPSSAGGTVSPSVLAVLRLMTSSNLVGC
jgi:hypothetical protein